MTIRIKKNAKVSNSRCKLVSAQQLFWSLKVDETQILAGARRMNGVAIYHLSALRLPDGELLIVATGHTCDQAIENYARRWQIETLFSGLKSLGFNFEDTHVTDRRRIKRLLIVAVIAFCWVHRVGQWQHEQVKPIKVKKHQRLAKSIFRLGLDRINEALFKLAYNLGKVLNSLLPFLTVNLTACFQ